ncbi:actin-like ATPase domain-containing protein [Nadsonia fulvescens var. elongata DSM 6958]|uniref:Actin-like ATPase domain-containing protein n=1 Tax=Nadsonia fulvescens var. elongata DSM 6958 TaxID=857566 RepID=A0A1E3PNY9_9ASCO|nr:actin-like ATPase domain-containing protein [Nadsonia fulvescens var. elongata DSM 6958]
MTDENLTPDETKNYDTTQPTEESSVNTDPTANKDVTVTEGTKSLRPLSTATDPHTEPPKKIRLKPGPKPGTNKRKKPDSASGDSSAASNPTAYTVENSLVTNPDGTPVVRKRGGSKPILKTCGIARVDNNMNPAVFSSILPINQKNYSTEYLKKDDQLLVYRAINEEAKKAKEEKLVNKTTKNVLRSESNTRAGSVDSIDGGSVLPNANGSSVNGGIVNEDDEASEKDLAGSKTIVIQPGSRYLRIGLASDAYPKTVPNVIAHKLKLGVTTQSSTQEPALPYRFYTKKSSAASTANGSTTSRATNDEEVLSFGSKFTKAHKMVKKDLRERMRFYKRRIVPNSHEMVVNFNRRTQPEQIPDHNDPYRIEWTEVENNGASGSVGNHENDDSKLTYLTGDKVLKLPEPSKHKYKVRWPIQYGTFNETATDYGSPQEVLGDLSLILMDALEQKMEITFKEYGDYNVILLIPDLYEKTYVSQLVGLLLGMKFSKVCILQESLGATFGAGISTACVIDIGAQTTKISCVEEGMVIPDSRVNLKYGGDDITEAFSKLLLLSSFPYAEIDLNKSHDYLIANELKKRFVTASDSDVVVQVSNFHARRPGKPTLKYQFKTFDEIMLASLGLFYPQLYEGVIENDNTTGNMRDKRIQNQMDKQRLFRISHDPYEPNRIDDPISGAMKRIMNNYFKSSSLLSSTVSANEEDDDRYSSVTSSFIKKDTSKSTAQPQSRWNKPDTNPNEDLTIYTPSITYFTSIGLDHAILESIHAATQGATFGGNPTINASSTTLNANSNLASSNMPLSALAADPDRRARMLANLIIVGGGVSKFNGFTTLLTDRIEMWRNARLAAKKDQSSTVAATSVGGSNALDDNGNDSGANTPLLSTPGPSGAGNGGAAGGATAEDIVESEIEDTGAGESSVMPVPRDMDPSLLSWKGGAVYARLKITNECWINANEWDILGSRCLQYKVLFLY